MNNFLDSGFNVLKDGAPAPAVGPTMSSVHVPVPMGNEGKKKKKIKYIDKAGDGIMIAWFPPEELATALASEEGEDVNQLHVTLAYFGKSIPDDQIDIIRQALTIASDKYKSLPGELGGVARFPATESSDGKDVIVMLADVPYLETLRENMLNTLSALGVEAYRNHGFCSHLTLAYVDPGEAIDISEDAVKRIPIDIDGLTFCINGERQLFPLSGQATLQKKMEDAPNYKEATDPARSCRDCVHGGDGYCDSYKFNYKSGWVCDSFMPLNKQFEKYTPPQPVQQNAREGLDEYKKTVNDATRANEEIMLLASDLANGVPVAFEKVKFISDYLTAHYNVEDSANWSAHGPEWQEWMGLGARAGLSWAKRCLRKQLEKGGPGSGPHAGDPAHSSTHKVFTQNGFEHKRISEKQSAYNHASGAKAVVNNKGEWHLISAPADVTHGAAYGHAEYTSKEIRTSSGKGPSELSDHFRNYPVQKDDEMSKHEANISLTASISKVDDDQHLVFGWASVATEKGIPVVDRQGDIITDSEMEKAAYSFVLDARVAGEMHKKEVRVGKLVESIVFTKEKQKTLGIDLGKTAWWVGFRVDSEKVWKAIKSGEYSAFSIHGRGLREEVTLES